MMSINLNKLKSQQDVKAAKAKIRKAYLESLKKVEEAFKTKTKPDVKLPKLEKKLTKNQKKNRKRRQQKKEKKQKNEEKKAHPVFQERDPQHQFIQPGDYYITFTMQAQVRDQPETINLAGDVNIQTPRTLEAIVDDMVKDHITTRYDVSQIGDYNVDYSKVNIRTKRGAKLRDLPVRGTPLQYKMFPNDAIINKHDNECMLDIIVYEMQKFYKTYNREQLLSELGLPADSKEPEISTAQIMDWAQNKHSKVSVFALDPFMRVFESHIPEGTNVAIQFMVNNDHAYPIVDKVLKNHVAKAKKLDLHKVDFDLGEMTDYHYYEEPAEVNIAKPEHTNKVLFIEVKDLSPFVKECIQRTGYCPANFESVGALVTAFEHPVTNQLIYTATDFKQRKAVCDAIHNSTKLGEFKFLNQSYSTIFELLTKQKIGRIPKSYYGVDLHKIFQDSSLTAYIADLTTPDQDCSKGESYDRAKTYSYILKENKTPYNMFDICSEAEIYDEKMGLPKGEYYVNTTFALGNDTIVLSRGWYPSVLIEFCLKQNILEKTDLSYVIKAASTIQPDLFKELVEDTYAKFPTQAKNIINHGVGNLAKLYRKSQKVAVTDSLDVAIAMMIDSENVKMTELSNMFFLRQKSKQSLTSGYLPIHRHIIASSYIQLHLLHQAVVGPETIVLGYNTDSIKVIMPKKVENLKTKEEATLGDIHKEPKCYIHGKPFKEREEFYLEPLTSKQLNEDELIIEGYGVICTGMPGSGKSTLIKELAEDDVTTCDLKVLTLAYTKTAVGNLSQVKNVKTFDAVFRKEDKDAVQKIAKNYDVIMVDEFTMIPKRYLSKLYEIKLLKPKMIFRFFGDPLQCHALEIDEDDKQKHWYHYHDKRLFHFLSDGNTLELAYKEGTSRYTLELKNHLDTFTKTKQLPQEWKDRTLFTEPSFIITKTPQMRNKINEKYHKKEKEGKQIQKAGDLELWVGLKLIAKDNYYKSIVNAQHYKVKALTEDNLTVKNIKTKILYTVPAKRAHMIFRYGYADTVARVQGLTIKKNFNIQEISKMSFNELYTAISRARNAESVGLKYNDKIYEIETPKNKQSMIIIDKPKATTGYIYKLSKPTCTKTYVGKTTQPIADRLAQHLDKPTSQKMSEWLDQTVTIEILEELKFYDDRYLSKREAYHISRQNPEQSLNSKLLIKRAVNIVEAKVEGNAKVEYEKFKIKEETARKAYTIRWSEENKPKTKRFPFAKRDKEEAYEEAKQFRAQLFKKIYGSI